MSFFQTLTFINQHELAKRHRLSAFARFFKWQFSQRLYPEPVAHPFIGETKLWVKKGMTGATGNIYTGLHDFEDMCFLLHFLRPGDLFIDIGANIGSYTVLAAGVACADCISIEPVPGTFEILKKNISINQLYDNVTALNIGVGSEKGVLCFTKDLDTVNHVIAASNQTDTDQWIKVPCESLDFILRDRPTPSLIKIDVEGFEQEVINGAGQLLTDPALKAIVIELNGSGARYGFDEHNIHQQLKAKGFNSYLYAPFGRDLKAADGFGNLNTIYLRDIPFIEQRLATAKAISIFSENI